MFVRQPIGDNFTWMHSGQTGAQQATGANTSNGDMLKILDDCLVDGFNPQNVVSVLIEAGTVTLDFGFINHGYELRQRVVIAGADDASLNGNHRIVALTPTTITINVLGVTQVTGVITTKIAPLGWESIFGATDPLKRAYRSLNPNSTQTVLYLDMSLPTGHGYNSSNPVKRAMVSMCADMQVLGEQMGSYTDVTNNYSSNANGSLFWYQCRDLNKSTTVSSTDTGPWVVVGNGDVFYFFTTITNRTNIRSKPLRELYVFGDMPSFGGDIDNFNCFWQGTYNPNDAAAVVTTTAGARVSPISSLTAAQYAAFFTRSHLGLGDLEFASFTPSGGMAGFTSGYDGLTFPNPVNNAIVVVPLYIVANKGLRAAVPRLLAIPQSLDYSNPLNFDLIIVDNILTIAVHYGSGSGNSYGYFAVDMGD